MRYEKIAFLANGEIEDSERLKSRIRSFPYLIAVDGGVNHCRELSIRPHLIIGDFDSAFPENLAFFQDVPLLAFPKEKDRTDLELALDHVEPMACRELVVFGGIGKRIDHTLLHLYLLSRYPGRLYLESAKERLFVIDGEAALSTFPGQTLSLIPLNGPAAGIYTQGMKWELSNAAFDQQFMSLSNVSTGTSVNVRVGSGDLLCILQLGVPL